MIPLPREHGAWAMLGLSLLTGGLTGPSFLPGIAFAAGWCLLFLAQEAWDRRSVPAPAPSLAPGLAASGLFLLGLSATNAPSGYVSLLAAAALTALVALALRARSRTAGRVPLFAWGPHLASAVAMAAPAGILSIGTYGSTRSLFLWGATAAGFGAGVLAVRVRRTTGTGLPALLVWSLAGTCLWLLLAPSLQAWLGWLALPARLLQLHLQPRLGWKEVGWSETALGLWMALCLGL